MISLSFDEPFVNPFNGFQMLVEARLLPGAMKRNENVHFISQFHHLKVINNDNTFLNKCSIGELLNIPIAHGEGSYYIDDAGLKELYANNEKIFSILSNEKAVIFLKPDYYIFRLETGGGMCPNIATSQETELKPNAEAEYRILLPSDMNLRLTRIK